MGDACIPYPPSDDERVQAATDECNRKAGRVNSAHAIVRRVCNKEVAAGGESEACRKIEARDSPWAVNE